MGVWELSLDDHTARRTLGHDRIFGYDALLPAWSYETFLEHVLEEDRPLVERKFKDAVANLEEWNFECRIRRSDGAIRWIWAAGRHRESETGGRLLAGVVQDITAHKEAQLRLIESEGRLKAIMDAAPIGISYSDDETCERITGNKALLAQFEVDENANVSASATDPSASGRRMQIYRNGRRLAGPELPMQRAVAERRQVGPVDLEIALPSGRRWIAQAYAAPILDDDDEALGGVAVTVDITERRAIEEALIQQERRLSLALSAGRLATWDWVTAEDEAIWNDEAFGLLGYRAEETTPGYEAWARRLHPDDRERVELAFAIALEEGGEFFEQYRILLPDGSIKWVEARGRMERENGRTARSYGVLIDTTERKRAEDALREVDRRKDEFLATLAHELRNPLAPIRSAMFLLRSLNKDEPDAESTARKLAGMVERQVNHLVRLVDDLLEVSRITRGKIVLRKEVVDLSAMIRQALQTSQPHIEARGHEVRLSDAGPLLVEGDPVRLTQIFTNILNNAAKYTPPQGHIFLDARAEGQEAVVRIRDDGVGITAEMLPKIFDLFVQSPRVAGHEQGGIGVGLALARRLVEMHGGRLDALSEGPGRGSEFVVRLPLAAPDCAKQTPRPDVTEAAEPLGKRALVVDDDRDVADSLALLLDHLGAQTRVAYDGDAAVRAVAEFRPDLIFLDLGMPGKDGYATAASIRRLPEAAGARLIALTGWGQNADRARTREAGFDLHLTKPASPDQVLAVLRGKAPES